MTGISRGPRRAALGEIFFAGCVNREISPRNGRQTLTPGVSPGLITTEGLKPASARRKNKTPCSVPFTFSPGKAEMKRKPT